MRTLTTHEQVSAVADAFAEDYGEVVVHGTSRPVKAGDLLVANTSSSPTMGQDGRWLDLSKQPPYVFASPPDCLNLPIFHATVKAHGVPHVCGARAVNHARTITFMAEDIVKDWTTRTNPLGRLCFLSAKDFSPSPQDNWAELVSKSNVRVLGVCIVSHSALSMPLADLPPVSISGISDEQLRELRRPYEERIAALALPILQQA